ncbi:hypothetical protein ACM26V_00345 [Salipaludibacillus sp. HK11]|uniref:hypothetical protein n=1 Tax=Salipaludibacillus sp. HK11 TaxID=3394320 RepID=UPI0039FCFE61
MRNVKTEMKKWKRQKQYKDKKKKSEKLSKADLHELMGTNRPTYNRGRGGAFRQN